MAESQGYGRSWKLVAAVIWLTFSVALATWWMVFGLMQLDRLATLRGEAPPEIAREIARQHWMLMTEGATLIVLLLGGGGALLYYIKTELQRSQKLRAFFAAFTHDLKTSLGSLRLQAESLEEDLKDSEHARLMRRLVKDTVRLELQLENSLLLASPDDSSRFLIEPVRLGDVFISMSHHWPELKIEVEGEAIVEGDQRAVESIFKNMLQNSVVHGRATQVRISITRDGEQGQVTIRMHDNGRGFTGDLGKLGEMFQRHGSTSGSGLGLYLAMKLARTMRGDIRFRAAESGFCVEVVLPEAGK